MPSYAKLPLPTTTATTATSPGLLLHHHHNHVAGIPFLQPRHHPPPPPPVVLSSARGAPPPPHANVSTTSTATTASASAASASGATKSDTGNVTVESLVGRIEVMSQVVEMQAEEIRQLRQTTARLEAKLARRKAANRESRQLVEELRERQREAEQEHARCKRRKVEELAATSTSTSTTTGASLHSISSLSSSSSPSPSSTSSPLAVPVNAHAAIGGLQSEIYRRMPFLRDYDIRASAIVNFSYPVCSFELPGPGGFTGAPPVLIYANAAFCHLTNYPLERLLGTPYHFTYVINLQHYKQAMVIGNNRPPFGVTEVYQYHSLLRCNGCLLRVDQNHQFFCDESGKMRYSLLCITDWEEGRLGETEILDQWLPPSAIGITADDEVAAPEPPPPLQLQPRPQPQPQPQPVPTVSLPSLLPPPHQQPQPIYPAHEQQHHQHHHDYHQPPALQQQQQHLPPAYHLQNPHPHQHQHHQQQHPPPHPNAVTPSDAEMAGWLMMVFPYPSESWPAM